MGRLERAANAEGAAIVMDREWNRPKAASATSTVDHQEAHGPIVRKRAEAYILVTAAQIGADFCDQTGRSDG
jgi:hypothetical protein